MDSKMLVLLAIDLVGTFFFVLGAMGLFGTASPLPESWRFPGRDVLLVAAGIAMMLPYMTYVIKRGSRKP